MRRSTIFVVVVCLLVAGGEMLARRPPAWLDDDPLLHPFGIDGEQDETAAPAAIPAQKEPNWPIDLATADAVTLQWLPGVGPVLAARIVAHRDSLGGIERIEQLDAVPGVGPRTLERIAPLLRVAGGEDRADTAAVAESSQTP